MLGRAPRLAVVLKSYLSVRALRSVFTKTNADRGKERYRRVSLTASTSIVAHALSISISLVSVPLTVHYLGQERYGVWLTISSILMWMSMTDFGLTGNALVNLIAEANGNDDKDLACQYASSAFFTLTAITISIGMVFMVTFSRIPWRTIFRVSPDTPLHELQLAGGLVLTIFVLMFPLNMLSSVYNAYQDGVVTNVWMIIGNALALASLVVVTHFRGGLPQLVVALYGTRFLVGLANAYYLFFVRYRWLAPRLSALSWAPIRRMLKLSSQYTVAQIAALGIGQSQPMIITQVLGPSYVPIFVVAHRILTLPYNLVFIATLPFVSAYGDAKARRDWGWIKGAVKNSTIISLVLGVMLVVIMAAGAKLFIRVWAGPAVVPDTSLILCLSIYSVLSIAVIPASQMLLGLERVGLPAVALVICAIATIKLGLLFTHLWGLTGLALAMTLSFLLTYCAGQAYMVRRALDSLGSYNAEAEACSETLTI